jgi:uncharacterized RDD family membrane protein YckC
MTTHDQCNIKYPGLFRRLFAIFYDCFLLLAILFIISGIAMALNHGKAIEPDNLFFPLYVLAVVTACFQYFSWFWIHGGQTLGMKTWLIKLLPEDGEEISVKTTVNRFITAIFSWAIFMLGFLWSFFDKKHRCWHDLSSHTYLIDLRQYK